MKNKNIFEAYASTNDGVTLTTESTVSAIELAMGEINYDDAVFTAENSINDADIVNMTLNATKKFSSAMVKVEAAVAAGDITTENAVIAATAYGELCNDLNLKDEDLKNMGQSVITIESASQYPESGVELTTQNANDLIKSVKSKSMEVIKRIITWFKTTGTKLAAQATSIEKSAIEVSKEINNSLTDELVDKAEISPEFLGSRLSVIGKFDKGSLISALEFANNPGIAKAIDDAFKKDLGAGKFEDIYKLPTLTKIDAKPEKKDGLEVTNEFVLTVNGKNANILVTRKNDKDELTLSKEIVKVKTPESFKSAKPLSRSELSDVIAKVVLVSKTQKDYVKKITDLVKMPDVKSEDTTFLEQVNTMLNIVTSSYLSIAMAAANTNRDVYAVAVKNSSLYKKKKATKEDK